MTPRAPKECGHEGCYELVVAETYCPTHKAEWLKRRAKFKPHSPSGRASAYDTKERQRRQRVVAAWVKRYGYVCPGWERPPHPSRDLTAAHAVAVAHGGVGSDLGVLCRSCNSRQGTKPSKSK